MVSGVLAREGGVTHCDSLYVHYVIVYHMIVCRFERFKTQSGEIRMTLIRAIFVRLSSLLVLFVTLLILISVSDDVIDLPLHTLHVVMMM